MTQEEIFREARRSVANSKLKEFRNQCWRLSDYTRRGAVEKIAAVDLLIEIAICHALVRSLGEDHVQLIISEAFLYADFNPLYADAAA
jgi:hypothetical protein